MLSSPVPEPAPTPLEVPRGVGHVAFFGGSFDPPHVAHVTLADLARRELERRVGSRVFLVFVPAARSPHKEQAPFASDAQRVAMLALAIEGLEHAAIWTDELDRATAGQPSYWVRTLERASALLGGWDLSFIIGADQALTFHRWRGPREMLAMARPLVLPRAPVADADQLRERMARAHFWTEDELDRWAAAFVPIGPLPAASTEVRDARGAPFETPLDPRVLRYAREHHLYGF